MKATLSFDLPEERSEHLLAIRGTEYYVALWAIRNALRDEDCPLSQRIWEILADTNLDEID